MDPDSLTLVSLALWSWVALLGAVAGGTRGWLLAGFALGLLWGPLGVLVAATLPRRE